MVDILGRYIYWRVWDFAVSYSDVATGSTTGRCEIAMYAGFGSYIRHSDGVLIPDISARWEIGNL